MACYLPSSEIYLFSPQVCNQNSGGKNIIFGLSWDSLNQLEPNWQFYWCLWVQFSNWNKFNVHWSWEEENCFSLSGSINFDGCHHFSNALLGRSTPTKERLYYEFSTYSRICCPCIEASSNANKSGPHKKLLLWHWKLGISMYCIQELMQSIQAHESSGIYHEINPVVPIFKSAPNLKIHPPCQSCQLAHSCQKVYFWVSF